LLNFDSAPLLTKYVNDIRDDQVSDGRFTDIAPHAHLTGTPVCVGSPGWADAGVSLPWELYLNTGNQRLLAEHFEAAKRWVEAVHASNPGLLWRNNRGQDWGDWLSAGTETPRELGSTAFFAHSADLLSRMAQVLEHKEAAEKYQTLFQDIRRAFVKNYVSSNGIIGGKVGQPLEIISAAHGYGATDLGDTQGSYALALRFGLLDEPLRSLAVKRLNELVVKNKFHPSTGFWSSIEMLLALTDSGYNETAAKMLTLRDEPSWGHMAGQNTTMWEAFNARAQNLSLNHWTHSAVSEWLWRNVAGLNPDEHHPGYETFTIHPRPTQEVTWCKASYHSIRGQIVSDWKMEGNKFTLRLTVPANTSATVYVPAKDIQSVTESGRILSKATGVKLVKMEADCAVLEVGSGDYQFVSKRS
jgi:alpha-L-rhamnosidase